MFIIGKHFRPTSFVPLLTKYLERPSVACLSRSFSSRSHNGSEEENDTIEHNPFYEKYKHKIDKVKESEAKPQTTNRFNRFLQRETKEWKNNIDSFEKRFSDKKNKDEGKISGLRLPANLDKLIKMELFLDKSAEEISKLWAEYWKGKNTVCAVIQKGVFDAMATRIKECPLFLYPFPREHGYEFYLAQFSDFHCFCTSLINYQVHGEDAPWHVCFKFYPELKNSKGIVLMTSEFDNSQLNIMEVQYLAQLQQLFYANPSETRYELMRTFNHNPDSFKHMDVVKEIERGDFIIRKDK